MGPMTINIDLQPIQGKLWMLYEYGRATKIGFGGPRGGTKSHSAMMVMLMRRIKYPQTNGLFIMRVYQDMMDIHIRPLFDAYPELEQRFNKQEMLLKLPNGSYIRFLSGDNLETFQRRKGRGFADIMIDQSELFSKDEIEFIYTINRSVSTGITPKILLCFNPGNIGHAYHKRVFYDKIFDENENPDDFAYIQAKGWDNAYWSIKVLADLHNIPVKDLDKAKLKMLIDLYHKLPEQERFDIFIKSDYGRNLNSLPGSRRRAELFGDMEIFEGMFFSDFRYKYHVVDDNIIQSSPLRRTLGGLDYGNVTVLTVLQRDSEGTIAVIGECYLADLTNPTDRANAIADYLIEKKLYNLEIIYDTDMEISQLSNIGVDKTPIAIFRDVFRQRMGDKAPIMRCVNKTSLDRNRPYRVVVNDSVKEFLKLRKVCSQCKTMYDDYVTSNKCDGCNGAITYQSKLYFTSTAKHLIKFISEAIYDPSDQSGGDFDRSEAPKKDHAYDSFKYAFMELYTPKQARQDNRPKWLIKIQQQERAKQKSISFMGV